MKIIIFESDTAHLQHLVNMLSRFLPSTEITVNPPSPFLLPTAENRDSLLIFLDTRYKPAEGNFLTLARKIREIDEACHICFTSLSLGDIGFCYKRLVKPSAFLLKPIEEAELGALISEIRSYESRHKRQPGEKSFSVQTREKKYVVAISDVLYFTAIGKKIQCCTETSEDFIFYGSLSKLEAAYPAFFLRCHSGFLVNMQRIECYVKSRMILKIRGSNNEIPVSKSRIKAVEAYIDQLLLS